MGMVSLSPGQLAWTATAGAALGGALTPAARALLARRGVLDHPNHRSSHEVPTPRGGGLAVAIAASVAVAVSGVTDGERWVLLVTAGLFGLVGLAEDVHPWPPLTRLVAQTVLAAAVVAPVLHGLGGPLLWRVVAGLATLVWLVGWTNIFNFMDGINGIAGAQIVAAGGTWTYLGIQSGHPVLAVSGLAVAAAACGFLPFNFPAAQIFLGDVGSYFVGAWLAVVAVFALRDGLPPEAVLAPLSVFGADAAWTLARRVGRGEVWYEAHRSHVYQRLTDLGWSHPRVTSLVAGLMAVLSLLGLVSLTGSAGLRAAADVGGLILLAGYLASPAWLARRLPAMESA